MLPSSRSPRLLPLSAATALALLVLDLAGFGPIVTVRRWTLSMSRPVTAIVGVAVAPANEAWHGAVHFDDVAEENNRLRRRVAELEGTVAGRAEVEADLQALLAATDIDYLGDVERVTARVISDRHTDLERIVEIDKGSRSGIAAGMPVVTGTGLVGRTEIVTGDRSMIRLITDVGMAVGVRSRHGLGLATGDRAAELRLEVTPELAEAIRLGAVVDGERFVTSGVDRSVYPAGIPVGTLLVPTSGHGLGPPSGHDGQPGEPSGADLALLPLASFDRLGYLTVLLIDPPA